MEDLPQAYLDLVEKLEAAERYQSKAETEIIFWQDTLGDAERRVAELEAALREIATWPTKVFPGNVTAYVPNHIHEIARRAL